MGRKRTNLGDENRHLSILYCIEKCFAATRHSPAVRKMVQAFRAMGEKVSECSIHTHIDLLEQEGLIASERGENGARLPRETRLTSAGRDRLAAFAPSAALVAAAAALAPVKAAAPPQPAPPKTAPLTPPPPRRVQIVEPSYVVLSARLSNHTPPPPVAIPVAHLISASFGADVYSSDFSVSALGPETLININPDLLPARLKLDDLFALEVDGDSMIDAGVHTGDYVIVKPAAEAENGDMCVVWIDEQEATLKYFYKEEKRVRLEPANPSMAPRWLGPSHTVTIQGKVVLVVRGGG